jgi:hypothetical protein
MIPGHVRPEVLICGCEESVLPQIVLTRSTHAHLLLPGRLLREQEDGDILEFLEQELARADLVDNDELEQTTATIGSRVL